jgi:hypothetical protein
MPGSGDVLDSHTTANRLRLGYDHPQSMMKGARACGHTHLGGVTTGAIVVELNAEPSGAGSLIHDF